MSDGEAGTTASGGDGGDAGEDGPVEQWSCDECGHTNTGPVGELVGTRVTKTVAEGTHRETEIETVVCPECGSDTWGSETAKALLETVEKSVTDADTGASAGGQTGGEQP